MGIFERKTFRIISAIVLTGFWGGCEGRLGIGQKTKKPAAQAELGATIGSLVEVAAFQFMSVEGYGLVGGLNGTGSSECPPQIRTYLSRYIPTQLQGQKISVDKLIESPNTAVVRLEGVMPAMPLKDQFFDVKVTALEGTRTISLEGGWLYTSELRVAGLGPSTKVIADVEGPIFIDKIDAPAADKRGGYILAGGRVLNDFTIGLILREPDYKNASDIRNRLSELFGQETARAVSPSRIEVAIPNKYRQQKEKFISLLRATYLTYTPQTTAERVNTFVRNLANSQDKDASEIALEAIGTASLDKLGTLLNSSDQQVRLRAARCMLNLGSDSGLDVLRDIAFDKTSAYRLEALEAITTGATRNDAAVVARNLLRDEQFNISLAAYEQLRKLDDVTITQRFISRSFYLEQVAQTPHKAIFVSRSGQPRIVLFGAPIRCRDNIFIQSGDGSIIINASAGQKYVTLVRKHPKHASIIGQMKSSFDLGDIIRTLCEEPTKKSEESRRGLGVSYSEMTVLLKQMCDKGAVKAQFLAGPLPKVSTTIKK